MIKVGSLLEVFFKCSRGLISFNLSAHLQQKSDVHINALKNHGHKLSYSNTVLQCLGLSSISSWQWTCCKEVSSLKPLVTFEGSVVDFPRLQTRERFVKIAEQSLDQKKQHCKFPRPSVRRFPVTWPEVVTEVVRAFQSALALLSRES